MMTNNELDELVIRYQREPSDELWEQIVDASIGVIRFAVNHWSWRYRASTGEEDAVQQSLLIMFSIAIPRFDPARGCCFRGFLRLVLRNRLHEVFGRRPVRMLDACSYNQEMRGYERDQDNGVDASPHGDRYSNLIAEHIDNLCDLSTAERELDLKELKAALFAELTPSEAAVLELYLRDLSYKEIAATLGITTKSADNCVMRIKRKAALLPAEVRELL